MNRFIKTTLIINFILLFAIISSVAQSDSAKSSDTQVLEERLDRKAEDIQHQLETLQNDIKTIKADYQREMEDQKKDNQRDNDKNLNDMNNQLRIYGIVVLAIFSIIAFVLRYLGKDYIDSLITTDIKDRTDKLFDSQKEEFKKKAEEQFEEIKQENIKEYKDKLNELDKVRDQYEKVLQKHRDKLISDDKKVKIRYISPKNQENFDENLKQLKEEKDYTATDWYILAANEKDHKMAIDYYSEAINKDNNDATFYCARGYQYSKVKDYDKSLNDYNKAIKLRKSNALLYLSVCEISLLMGEPLKARDYLEKSSSYLYTNYDKVIYDYLKLILDKIEGNDIHKIEQEFINILKEKFELFWSFEEIEEWLPNADLTPDIKQFITKITEQLKEKIE